MNQSLRRVLWTGTALVVVSAGVPLVQATAATTCAAGWSSTQVYVMGNAASQGGHNYTAKWWTQNESPATHSAQWDVWTDNGACDAGTPTPPPTTPTNPPTTPPTTPPGPPTPSGKNVVGYFAQWGVYGRQYFVKNLDTSGTASKLTHLLYAFGNTTGGQCSIGDAYADYQMNYTAANSVDGVADNTADDTLLKGSFNQLKKLKKKYPGLKVLFSFGGWTWSSGFTQAAANPTAFANSCYDLVMGANQKWAGVFDGIDIDWEYPNACGLSCDASGLNAYGKVIQAVRDRFGSKLVTSAISADGSNGGKLDVAKYEDGIKNLDLVFLMSYDYFGAFAPQGPTAPHSPLTSYAGIPAAGFYTDAAVQKLKGKGVQANKILIGIGFYGRGWSGVTQALPGGSATGAAPGTYEAGIEDYKVLKNTCPPTGQIAGTSYAKCGSNWYSYDIPSTIASKMTYVKQQGLGGAFFWEASGDTSNGELVTAIKNNL